MPMTFADCYRTVRLYASAAPVFLCREWVNAAWKSLASRRTWGFLRGDLAIVCRASRTLTVTVTQGSATVTSAAAFVTDDVGRALRVGRGDTYTILAWVDAGTVTLDRVYVDVDAVTTGTILDAYVTLPADFGSFLSVVDLTARRPVTWLATADQLDLWDPDRTTGGDPRAVVTTTPSPVAATLGQVRVEVWPRQTSARILTARYAKQADRLTDTDTFTGVLADAGEVVIAGALAHAASWPGMTDLRNPYFDLRLAQAKKDEFEWGVQRLALKDDAQTGDDYSEAAREAWHHTALTGDDHAVRASDASA